LREWRSSYEGSKIGKGNLKNVAMGRSKPPQAETEPGLQVFTSEHRLDHKVKVKKKELMLSGPHVLIAQNKRQGPLCDQGGGEKLTRGCQKNRGVIALEIQESEY